METGRQVGVLVHRTGQVDYVVVGDAGRLMLPDIGRLRAAEGRFRGVRLLHTHLRGEPLTRDDLVDLVRLRLDLVAAIQVGYGGEARSLVYAHNVPRDEGDDASPDELPYRAVGPVSLARGQVDVDVLGLMTSLEAEFARRRRARVVRAKDGRAILVHVVDKASAGHRNMARVEESVRELRELARTAGTDVADVVVQVRERIDPRTVLGRGKLDEVVIRAIELDADVLVFDRELSPAQASAIAKVSDLKVIDRTQLILDIFAQRAESKDGKLQVELAQLKYSLPRLAQKDDSLSRLTGGIGGRGPGETTLEIGRRRARERVTHLERQLEALEKQRTERRRRRGRERVKTVAIVGYTNAGKSTLLNSLTGAGVLAEDKLFATLDTRSRRARLPAAEVAPAAGADAEPGVEGGTPEDDHHGETVILTDTVGFIRDLPKDLFAAFRATFEEAAGADVLVQVVDGSDPAKDDHMAATEDVLEALDLHEIPRILVFNKVDLLEEFSALLLQRTHPDAVLMSATEPASARTVLAKVRGLLEELAAEAAAQAAEDEGF